MIGIPPLIDAVGERFKNLLKPPSKLRLRWLFLTTGLALLVFAQYALEQRDPVVGHSQRAEIWNVVNRLEIANYDNVWLAIPYLFIGITIWVLLANLLYWEEPKIADSAVSVKAPDWKPVALQLLIVGASYIYLILKLAGHQYNSSYPFIWILIIVWLTRLVWKRDKLNCVDLSFDFSTSDLISILLLLFIGLALGTFALTDLPNQVISDERAFWDAAYRIAQGEVQASPFDIGVFTFPLSTSILQAWVMHIFGINIWGWRFSSVISAVVTVIPLYLLTRDWLGRRIAFAAGLIMLVNPYFLIFSRLGYNNSQSLFPVVLAIYLWERGIRKSSSFYQWLGGLAAGFGYYSFFAAWIAPVTIVFSIVVLLTLKQIQWKRALRIFSILATAWSMAAVPRIVFAVSGKNAAALVYKIFEASFVNVFYARAYYWETDLVRTMPLITVGAGQTIFYDPGIYFELLTRGLTRTLLAILDPFIVTEHFMVSGLAGVVSPIFFVIGLAITLRKWKQYRVTLLLIWLFGSLLFLSTLIAFPPHYTFLVVTIPAFALLSALGLVACADHFSAILPQKFGKSHSLLSNALVTIGLIAIGVFSLTRFFVTIPTTYPASFEDYASWIAWRANEPVNIVYVTPKERPTALQYLSAIKLVSQQLFTIKPGGAIWEAIRLRNEPTIIFYEGADDKLIEEMKNAGYENFAVYRDKNDNAPGLLFTNTMIDLTPSTDFKTEFAALIQSPVTPLLTILLVILLVTIIWKVVWPMRMNFHPNNGIQ